MNLPPPVLYAEDDENDAFFMERAFRKLKQSEALRLVRDGAEALDYLAGEGRFADRAKYPLPSLVVLDVKMPRLSGLEVLCRMRRDPRLSSIPVVMFTSSTHDSDITFSRAHGANAYFEKPSNAEHLALLMADLMKASAQLEGPRAVLPVAGNRVQMDASD